MKSFVSQIFTLTALLLLIGCSEKPESELIAVRLQTDWFPQVEHAGFYQALAKGYYEEEGLEVTILPGGPNSMSIQKVVSGRVDFAMNRVDTLARAVAEGLDIQFIMTTLQNDPQAIMVHSDSPVEDFNDLNGRTIMAVPGMTWIDYLKKKYKIEFAIIPHDFGMERFLTNSSFIQQCLLTNEPYYAAQNNVAVRTLLIRDSGYNPYHGIYCLSELASAQPDLVRAFVRASIRGWIDFLENDPDPAYRLIEDRNPRMSREFMNFTRNKLLQGNLIYGNDGIPENMGRIEKERIKKIVDILKNLKILETEITNWYTTNYLPERLQ